jgi:pilus assembly protein Flp/PilA
MMSMIIRMRTILRNEEGQDLIEYAMLVALIALFCVGAVTLAGGSVRDLFNSVGAAIPAA